MKTFRLSALCGAALLAMGSQTVWAADDRPAGAVHLTDSVRGEVQQEFWAYAEQIPDGKGYSLNWAQGCTPDGTACQFFGNGAMNPDPVIGLAMGIVDLGAPSTFSVTSTLVIVPTAGPVWLTLTIGGSCTDFGKDGCSATLVLPDLASGSLDGPSYVFGGTGFGTATPGGSASFATTIFSVYLPALTTYTSLDMHLDFMGSGGGDLYSFTQKVEVTAVPEPATYALLLAGLAAVGFVAGRRNKR